jgi:hypothetical protein
MLSNHLVYEVGAEGLSFSLEPVPQNPQQQQKEVRREMAWDAVEEAGSML